MESALPPPHSSPEVGPVRQGETNPNIAPKPVEQSPQRAPEQQPRVETRETKVGPGGGDPQSAPTQPVPTLPPIVPQVTDDTSAQAARGNGNPAVANDDDLIEKEWVDKAKKIVSETKSDPYRQEQEVNKLQADYLKKRWGKEINVPND
jgi:hypothetical protein